jgi:hypothetical protein
MVILDNDTRWNSVYLSISRALRLQVAIQYFCEQHSKKLTKDLLDGDDWRTLKDISAALEPFWAMTLRLQGHASNGHHGAIWEALPVLELLLHRLEELKHRSTDRFLSTCINNAWLKLHKYWELTDNSHQIYALATLLHPALRKQYFDDHWTDQEKPWIQVMIENCRKLWTTEYKNTTFQPQPVMKQDTLDEFLFGAAKPQMRNQSGDEFHQYYIAEPTRCGTSTDFDIASFWAASPHSALRQLAFDTLSVPAMSTECERTFSSAKKTVSPSRNGLKDDIIEATECLKAWWDNGLIQQEE